MSNFLDRLDRVLAGRTIFPWGASVGLYKASITNIQKGGEPNSATLRRICAIERCSAEWLNSGKGKPFMVNNTLDSSETFRAVAELVPMATNVLLVHDGVRLAIALGTPIEQAGFSYMDWRVVAGPVNSALLELLSSDEDAESRVANVPANELQRLVDGDMGNWELIGAVGGRYGAPNPNALYQRSKTASNWVAFKAMTSRAFAVEENKIAEPTPRYRTSLGDLIDQLPDDQRDAVELIVRGLLGQH